MKVLFTYDYGKEKMDSIRALGYEVEIIDEGRFTPEQVPYDSEVMCCYNPFVRLDITKFPNLKLIQLSSIGFDFIPKEDILNKSIILSNNRGGYSIPMGEWIVMNLLMLSRKAVKFWDNKKEKKWKLDSKLTELYGKTVTFLGTGTISSEAAKRLQGFEMNVVGVNTKGTDTLYFDKVYALEEVKTAIEQADYLVMVLPFTERTNHFLDKEKLSWMKNTAMLINVSRGNVIDEVALTEALKSKTLAGAALDVFEEEPLSSESELWEMDNVFISPHNSWISEQRDNRRFNLIYENLKAFIQNKPLKNVVDIKRGY